MKRALAVFVASLGLGALGLWLVYRDALLSPSSYRLVNPNPYLLVAVPMLFALHLLFPTLKLLYLCRYQGMPMRLGKAVLVHFTSVFGAVITPSNAGGGPALVVALSRLGYPVGKGVGIASQVFILDLIFFAWSGPLGLAYLIYTRTLQLPLNAELLTLAAVVLALGLALTLSHFPKQVSAALLWLAQRRPFRRFQQRLGAVARDYYRSAQAYLTFSTRQHLTLHLFTALGWMTSYLMLWALLGLYGVARGPLTVVALLAAITLLANFVPTPGGSGFIEAAVGLTAAGGEATAPVVLWRLFNYYAFFLLGPLSGWLLYRSRPFPSLRRRGRGGGRRGGGKARP